MGNEATCRVDLGDQSAEAKALLETEELILRGALKAKIPFTEATDVTGDGGVLRLRWKNRDVRIHLGSDAAKWAEKIRNPKSVLDKLGVKPGQKISVIGKIDEDFLEQLKARGVGLSKKLSRDSDVIFLAINRREELGKLNDVRGSLAPAGALWVIRPKGVPEVTEAEVMSAGKAAGLVDVKVVKFSPTHTAEKFVVPLAKRP